MASHVAAKLNEKHHLAQHKLHPYLPTLDPQRPDPSQPNIATALPLDGYHLTRAQLHAMPNPEEAVFRRGAPFTFDGQAYYELVKKLRRPIEASTRTIYAPSFDHAVKDPVTNDIPIHPTTRIVLLEGNYVALNQSPWSDAAKLMDELWFVSVPIPVATARLVKRHVAAGISPDPEHALKRVNESDMRNGQEIIDGRLEVQEVIESIEDESWKTEDLKMMEEELEKDRNLRREEGMARLERQDSIAQLAADGVGL